MSDRPALIRRAALRVVAAHGIRALTHRAVDRDAGLPLGSTANVFSTRVALIGAVVAEYERQDVALLDGALGAAVRADTDSEPHSTPVSEQADEVGARAPEPSIDAVVEALASFAAAAASEPAATLTRARLALMLAEPEAMQASHRRVLDRLTVTLAAAGVAHASSAAERVAALLDGTSLHRLTVAPDPPLDVVRFREALRRLLE